MRIVFRQIPGLKLKKYHKSQAEEQFDGYY